MSKSAPGSVDAKAQDALDKALRKGLADAEAGRVIDSATVWRKLRAEFPWIEAPPESGEGG